jgi:hypothetical protein
VLEDDGIERDGLSFITLDAYSITGRLEFGWVPIGVLEILASRVEGALTAIERQAERSCISAVD